MRRIVIAFTGTVLVFLMIVCVWAYWLFRQPLALPDGDAVYILEVPKGATLTQVARALVKDGILRHTWLMTVPARFREDQYTIKAGCYEVPTGTTIPQLFEKLVKGASIPVAIQLAEGARFEDYKRALRDSPDIVNTLLDLPDAEILRAIGAAETSPEGLFFPDTYHVASGSDDLSILKKAYQEMQMRLTKAWENRSPDLPLASPYEALILASIIEKEAGMEEDRLLVASVFVNRLKIGMRLQADPTVIYGMGSRYQGRILRRDLDADTPYNTYTRDGLPPTPIASVSQASLDAAVRPPTTKFLYFVAHSDKSGNSVFSETLSEHNRAVSKHILKKK
ncbi:MAG: endolytic transglycosylase MltG [Burkholderiales bacterium]|jgi:UPF0755 protein|nr:endolytic transglycosylase MltG [Burkholderiales bacterium]